MRNVQVDINLGEEVDLCSWSVGSWKPEHGLFILPLDVVSEGHSECLTNVLESRSQRLREGRWWGGRAQTAWGKG